MKILIFGGKGYLGQYFKELYPDADTPDVDIADQDAVKKILDERKPDVVINCAGKTGRPNVDWCEDHKEETLRSNVTGPLILMHECLARSIYLVQIGSGCIYEGDNGGKGFSEEDKPNFTGSFYSRTKLWIDQAMKDFPVLVLRLRMPFDATQNPRNLVTKIMKYNRVLDVQNSLTFLPDLLSTAEKLIAKRATGIYNVVNPGGMSPFEIMTLYKETMNPAHTFERLDLKDLPEVAKAGRSNCILSGEKLEKEGIVLPPAKERIKLALEAWKS